MFVWGGGKPPWWSESISWQPLNHTPILWGFENPICFNHMLGRLSKKLFTVDSCIYTSHHKLNLSSSKVWVAQHKSELNQSEFYLLNIPNASFKNA